MVSVPKPDGYVLSRLDDTFNLDFLPEIYQKSRLTKSLSRVVLNASLSVPFTAYQS